MAIIALVAALAVPQLMPAILLSKLEGASRHIAGYGRAAMSEATLMRETITVKVNLDKQEYWATRTVNKKESIFDEDKSGESKSKKSKSKSSKSSKSGKTSKNSSRNTNQNNPNSTEANNGAFLNLLGYTPSEQDGSAWGESAMSGAELMRKQFDRFAESQMVARSKQVKREGLLDEIGPLFDKKFSLSDTEETEEELTDPLLSRTSVPDGVVIQSIRVGGSTKSKGEVTIEVTPLGLGEPVAIYLKGEDDSYYTVTWDAITGNVHVERGKNENA